MSVSWIRLGWPYSLAVLGIVCGCSAHAPTNTDGGNELEAPPPVTRPIQAGAVRSAYEDKARDWLEQTGGMRHTPLGWKRVLNWSEGAQAAAAQKGYYIQYATTPALYFAEGCADDALLVELAEYYLVYLDRFETFETLRKVAQEEGLVSILDTRARPSDRTLRWVQPTGDGLARMRECLLCNAQLLYPLARLLRLAAGREETSRPEQLQELGSAVPFLVREHVIRGFQRLERESEAPFDPPSDRPLWLAATAAELLGAHRADPDLVPLTPEEDRRLRDIAGGGARSLQANRHVRHIDGIQSVSFFDGAATNQAEYRFAGSMATSLPTEPVLREGVGWDVSHYHRVPILLRAFYDNRSAAGLGYPNLEELESAANHAAGLFARASGPPQLVNFSDGSDGWYRVDTKTGFGYPPSAVCDSRTSDRPCLTGGLMGWSVLAFSSSHLTQVLLELAEMALSSEPTVVEHRRRTLTFNGEDFTVEPFSTLAFFVFAGSPELLDGCPARSR